MKIPKCLNSEMCPEELLENSRENCYCSCLACIYYNLLKGNDFFITSFQTRHCVELVCNESDFQRNNLR